MIDGAIAAQNICLAAQELGLGAVWLGTWPQMDRVEAQQKLFGLPETIVPHSIIALGSPEADLTAPRESRYEDDRYILTSGKFSRRNHERSCLILYHIAPLSSKWNRLCKTDFPARFRSFLL